jgi:hypothetical protein
MVVSLTAAFSLTKTIPTQAIVAKSMKWLKKCEGGRDRGTERECAELTSRGAETGREAQEGLNFQQVGALYSSGQAV